MQVTRGKADYTVKDGRITIELSAGAQLYLETPDQTPLSASERHATLRIVSDVDPDGVTELELDKDGLDALADALIDAENGGDTDA
ncbi:hypothetical protein EFA46_015935 (plasmid) [Halarchaeum sp. CBA1220]|uniref:hypothetical protein n=1 Tax=Halarchaeum sp. CBA1220 TaxID=1853682 RepID=UPI000F3AA7BB|nr:hypothetical protein [Halarchaeum sp. CBA1220]QLC35747.1 hypothetical protein EFA46_015935 [Halarchaeum sp. CBA1220]